MKCGLLIFAIACGSSPKHVDSSPPDDTGPMCEPGRCLGDVSRAVDDHRAEARACYDKELAHQPKLQGRLIINFTIDPAGNVVETSQGMQDNQISDPDVVMCVGEVVKKITFAKSPSGKTTRAYHRFEFSPH